MPKTLESSGKSFLRSGKIVPIIEEGVANVMALATIEIDRIHPVSELLQYRLVDIFLAQMLYAGMAIARNPKQKLVNAGFALALSYATEIGQGLGLVPGGFDWGDFVAYTVGVVGLAGAEKAIEKIRRK